MKDYCYTFFYQKEVWLGSIKIKINLIRDIQGSSKINKKPHKQIKPKVFISLKEVVGGFRGIMFEEQST